MHTHAVPSGGFPWDTPGGRFGQFSPARLEDLYLLVSLRVVRRGGTTPPVTRFPRRTFPSRPALWLPPLGVECHPTTTTAVLGLCLRLLMSSWDSDGPLEDAPPYARRRVSSEWPWSPCRGGDTHGRSDLACYMRGNCSSMVAQSALYPFEKDPTGPVTAAVTYLRGVARAARRSRRASTGRASSARCIS